MLFATSILENIRYGKLSASDHEVEQAAKAARVLEFSDSFPDGLHTQVGSRGTQLSGGQKQRVAVARVILKDPPRTSAKSNQSTRIFSNSSKCTPL